MGINIIINFLSMFKDDNHLTLYICIVPFTVLYKFKTILYDIQHILCTIYNNDIILL